MVGQWWLGIGDFEYSVFHWGTYWALFWLEFKVFSRCPFLTIAYLFVFPHVTVVHINSSVHSYVHYYVQILNFTILHIFCSCHDIDTLLGALTHIFPNYCATFLPMAAIMIVNPILYCCSTQDVRFMISVRLGQYTQRERNAVDGIKTKFLFIIITFYICWLPNLICGVLIWSLWIKLPENVIVFLWYVMVSIYFNILFVFFWVSCAHFWICVTLKTAAWRYLYWSVNKY